MKNFTRSIVAFLIISGYNILALNAQSFNETVLNDFSEHSNYIVLFAKNKVDTFPIVVDNYSFFSFLSKKNKLTFAQYKEKALCFISGDSVFEVPNKKKLSYDIVFKYDSIQKDFENGKEYFINKYTTQSIFNLNLNSAQEVFVIYCLFLLEVRVVDDCETGAKRIWF